MHSEKLPIYLDNNATTAIDPEVLQAMLPYLTSVYGNPASDSHAFGWTASNAVKNARAAIAATLNAAHARDVIFTSGATESINLAILGLFNPQGNHPEHIITSMTEHKAVLDACNKLADQGKSITYLRPGTDGIIPTQALRCAITDKTRLVSIMAANNETGTLQNISEIGRICAERQILFHTDATQALGKIDLDVQRMNISMASFSAHKIYGPKGVGALYINTADPRIALAPIIVGGGHERGLRSGTLNVPGIVGFARAAELATTHISSEPARLSELRDRLRTRLLSAVPAARVNGHPTECLPGVLSISFAGIDASSLLLELPDIALSSGSACTSAQQALSHVLLAMGATQQRIQSSVRIGIGRFNTRAEIDYAGDRLIQAVKLLRSMNPHSGTATQTF
ncbi:Cysteine desulfurase [compost metagenome]